MKSLQRTALLVGFILMSLITIFHVKIGHTWVLVPFIIYASITIWNLIRATVALIYSFVTKGWDKTMEILKENSEIQDGLRKKSYQTVEDCIRKLWE